MSFTIKYCITLEKKEKKEKPIVIKNNFYREGGLFYVILHNMKYKIKV